jgi:protein-tyrosine phosphatase
MAATLLRRHLAGAGVVATVTSAGIHASDGMPATDLARLVTGSLDGHRSRRMRPADLAEVDLVLCMERGHLREVVVDAPEALARTFTLRELVRRGTEAGPRRDDESPGDWLRRVGAGRVASDFVAGHPDDDVVDPIGRPLAVYEATHAELDRLTAALVGLIWP